MWKKVACPAVCTIQINIGLSDLRRRINVDWDDRLKCHRRDYETVEQSVVHITMNVGRANMKYRAKFLSDTEHIREL